MSRLTDRPDNENFACILAACLFWFALLGTLVTLAFLAWDAL